MGSPKKKVKALENDLSRLKNELDDAKSAQKAAKAARNDAQSEQEKRVSRMIGRTFTFGLIGLIFLAAGLRNGETEFTVLGGVLLAGVAGMLLMGARIRK